MAVIRCQKFFQGMIDLARFALVFRTSGQTADQSVGRFAAFGSRAPPAELPRR